MVSTITLRPETHFTRSYFDLKYGVWPFTQITSNWLEPSLNTAFTALYWDANIWLPAAKVMDMSVVKTLTSRMIYLNEALAFS